MSKKAKHQNSFADDEIQEGVTNFQEQDGLPDPHPHDLELPFIGLIMMRLNEGDCQWGLTAVLKGALGVAQFRTNLVELSPDNEFDNRLALHMQPDGRIKSAIWRD